MISVPSVQNSAVDLLQPPTIIAQPSNQTGRVGESVTFRVEASGSEPLSYQWRFRGEALEEKNGSELLLDNLQMQDLGPYSVVVHSQSGSVTSQVARLSLVARIRPQWDPGLKVHRDEDQLLLDWKGQGLLEEATTPGGPWSRVANRRDRNAPATVMPTEPTTFFRLRNLSPRTTEVFVPSSYQPNSSLPLIILLHGFRGNGQRIESWFRFLPWAETEGFLYCFPDGSRRSDGDLFWNGTDSCCDFLDSGSDDSGFLRGLILETIHSLGADPKRVYLVGHSNGGFMVYRAACDHADLIAGIVSFAGATYHTPADCRPSEPVHVLQIHGDADESVPYEGGVIGGVPYPGAVESVAIWASYNGASGSVTNTCTPDRGIQQLSTQFCPTLDLDGGLGGRLWGGLDTVVTQYTNAPPGGAVELWTIQGGSHNPSLTSEFAPLVIDWLLAHPRP